MHKNLDHSCRVGAEPVAGDPLTRGVPAARRPAGSPGTSEPGFLGRRLAARPARLGLLLSWWTPEDQLKPVQLLKFLRLIVLGLVIFTFNVIYPVFSLGLFLLPIIPLARLAYSEYRARLLQAAAEVLLAITAVVLAL